MKDEAVVVALRYEALEVGRCVGRGFRVQFDLDFLAVFHFDNDHCVLLYWLQLFYYTRNTFGRKAKAADCRLRP
jgi:hypothetical protein